MHFGHPVPFVCFPLLLLFLKYIDIFRTNTYRPTQGAVSLGRELPTQAITCAHLLDLCSVKSAGGLNTLMHLLGGAILSCCDPPSTHLTFPTNQVLNFYKCHVLAAEAEQASVAVAEIPLL